MKAEEYESLSYKIKFKRACKTALLVFILSLAVIGTTSWLWMQSIEKRQTLREAKNVVRNMNLLALEFYAFNAPIGDGSRMSGMSAEAEERIRSFSGADGEIRLIAWDAKNNRVAAMNYQKGRFLVEYRMDASKKPKAEEGSGDLEEAVDNAVWSIYRKIQVIGEEQ